jgi:phage/plasmid primase-like uncharacterized protein
MSHSVNTMRAHELATRLGLKRYPRSWRGRCPACDYLGTFSVRTGRDGRAHLFCASCRDRDALANAVARAATQDRCQLRQRRQERALALWRGSEPATGTLADRYLTARGLPGLAASPALRFRRDCPHPERARLPALTALVCDVEGVPHAVHRTYLTRAGDKAAVEPARASLGPIWGSSIRLFPANSDSPLVIAEGIETAASAGRLLGLPAWAAISAGNMAKGLVLPPEARRVIIAADPDPAARIAVRDASLRWRAEGRRVQIAMPDGSGDFNDLLRERGATHV